MNLAAWLRRSAQAHPTATAVGCGTAVARSYGELGSAAARLAGAFSAAWGLRPGDRIAIVSRNRPEYVEALFAAWHAGLIAVPVNAKLHGNELAYVLEHSGSRACLVDAEAEPTVAAFAPPTLERLARLHGPGWDSLMGSAEAAALTERRSDDGAWLFYTSGTTGRPKGALLTHGNLAAATMAYAAEVDPVRPGDAILHAAPMSHGSGLYLMAHVLRGGVNVVPESGGFEPDEIAGLFHHWRRMSMFAAPTMVKRLVLSAADLDPAAVRTIVYGGAPMYVEDALAALDRLGPCLAQIYRQGESPMTITTLGRDEIADRSAPGWAARLGSAGRAYASIEVAVVDEAGCPLPHGEAGEVICRGPTVMAGYWRDPDATAAALRDGWLWTGDVGVLDRDGYLTLKDRSKDVVISGGSNIYPREVEEALLAHPRVREVSVIGRRDPDWGEAVVAYVVGEASEAELDALCLGRIARFKRPKRYVFVASLPKNNYGKVLKTALRDLDAQAVAAGEGGA